MRIWTITVGEPLPVDAGDDRPQRTGMLVRRLVERGHDVVWWSSTWNHARKSPRADRETVAALSDRLELRMLHGMGYARNVCWQRIANHVQIARRFARQADRFPAPDVILCSLPTVELSLEAVRYARPRGIPVVLDVRDLWPDLFAGAAPLWSAPVARPVIRVMARQAREALEGCSGIVGISEGYLDWGLRYAGRARNGRDAVFPLGYQPPSVGAVAQQEAGDGLRALGVDPAKTLFWFVGMFGKTYDLSTVIEAARILARDGETGAQFVLSGDGEDAPRLRRQAEGLPNVAFTGWINAPQIAWMLRAARVGLMAYAPDAPQGLPNKLFEYMSAGLPILACLPGETGDLLARHGCGLSYAPGDPQSLAQGVRALFADPDACRRMGDAGREAFRLSYDAEQVYSDMAAHLERLAFAAKPAAGVESEKVPA